MTVAHRSEPVAAASADEAMTALRERGLRISAARRLVIEGLFAAEGPVSADQIAAGLGGRLPGSDIASVYRNLETLERAGLVRHFHAGHGPGLYALAAGDGQEYLACESCGRVEAVAPERLDAARALIRDSFGFEAGFSHFPIVGLCRGCAAKGDRRK